MRTIGGTAQATLESGNVRGVAFVQLDFDSGTQRLTTAASSVEWNSQTWVGLGSLLTIEPIRETEGGEITGGKLVVSGVAASEISKALTENIQGRPATMWFGVMSESYAIQDAPVEFIGRMDRYKIMRGNPSSTLELSIESEMALARRAKVRRFTQEDQQSEYASDTFFAHLLKTKELIVRFPTAEAARR